MIINQLHYLYSVGSHKMAGKIAYPLHGHSFGEIFWVARGEMLHRINGREQMMRKGDCAWLRPCDVHSLHSTDGRKVFWIVNIAFQWSIYKALCERYFHGDKGVYGEDGEMPRFVHFDGARMERLAHDAVTLVNAPTHHFNIERFLMNVIAEAGRWGGGESAGDAPKWLNDAHHLFKSVEHFRKGAAGFYPLCGKSVEHVSREFRRCYGKTVQEYAQELKMHHAAILLEVSTKEIADIAMDCGFDSLSQFYLRFRQHHELTPVQYRRRCHEKMYPD